MDIEFVLEVKHLDIPQIAARYALGVLPVDDLPDAAADALEAGYDTPSLRLLAGAQGRDREEIQSAFHRTLLELGLRMPSQQEAALSAARDIARSVLEGQMSPYQGARRIWWDFYVRFGEPEQLKSFVGLASEYEDDATHRDKYSRLIIEECERLVSDTG